MDFKVLEKAEREIRKLVAKDPKLAAEVLSRLRQLENAEFEKLDIKLIKRKKGKYKIGSL